MAYSPAAAAVGDAPQAPRTKDKAMATGVIGAHGLEHMYGHGFMALIPAIYDALGLVPIQASLIPAVRQLSSGLTSVFGGFLVDMFQERRGPILAFSMALIGLGYFLVAALPVYGLILAALVVASAGSALWHPPALGLLAQRFPQRRGFFMSLHRSAGNVGDTIGPVVVGVLLGVVGWRWIAGGGTPILIFLAFMILIFLWNVGGQRQPVLAGSGAGGHAATPTGTAVCKPNGKALKTPCGAAGLPPSCPSSSFPPSRGMGDPHRAVGAAPLHHPGSRRGRPGTWLHRHGCPGCSADRARHRGRPRLRIPVGHHRQKAGPSSLSWRWR